MRDFASSGPHCDHHTAYTPGCPACLREFTLNIEALSKAALTPWPPTKKENRCDPSDATSS